MTGKKRMSALAGWLALRPVGGKTHDWGGKKNLHGGEAEKSAPRTPCFVQKANQAGLLWCAQGYQRNFEIPLASQEPGQTKNRKALHLSTGGECQKGLQSAYPVQYSPCCFKFAAQGQGFGVGFGKNVYGIGCGPKPFTGYANAVGNDHVKVLA